MYRMLRFYLWWKGLPPKKVNNLARKMEVKWKKRKKRKREEERL